MKLAIMQPYFFPYIGYFQLMQYVDRWVVFDDTQFVHKGWVNRNRVLHPDTNKEWIYLTVPLAKMNRSEKIRNVSIRQDSKWQNEILGKLSAYRRAPHYRDTIDLVRSCIDVEGGSLLALLVRSIRLLADYLDIRVPVEIQSDLNLSHLSAQHPGQWALLISQELNADSYVNPHGGVEIFRQDEFDAAGIELKFLQPDLRPYDQGRDDFVAWLSIIDVLMWNGRDTVTEMLHADFSIRSLDELRDAGEVHR